MESLQLRVASGPQKGASMTLQVGASVTVGGGDDHRILLRDPALEGRALRLQVEATTIVVQVLSGSVIVNGTSLSDGQTLRISGEAQVQLGETLLQLSWITVAVPSSRDTTASRESADPRESLPTGVALTDQPDSMHGSSGTVQAANDAIKSPSGGNASSEDACGTRVPASRWVVPGGLCTLGLLLLGLALGGAGTLRSADDTAAWRHALAARLVAEGFDTLSVDTQATPAIVRGFLATREESMRLDALLRREPGGVQSRVKVGENLAKRVQDVFRLNGVDATVSVPAAGQVLVSTQVADEAVLQRIAGQARRDIPQLTDLELSNTIPTTVASAAPPVREIPGKRVAMVVSDAPAHVVTEDRSRYFVGSVLPSGHRITAINAGTVSLIKSGQRTDLEF